MELTTALWITVIGMGIVFGAILLFWAFMSVLVRLAADDGQNEAVQAEAARVEAEAARIEARSMAHLAASEAELRRRAAVASVLVALAEQEAASVKAFPLPPTAFVSSWQAVMRARQLGERGTVR